MNIFLMLKEVKVILPGSVIEEPDLLINGCRKDWSQESHCQYPSWKCSRQ